MESAQMQQAHYLFHHKSGLSCFLCLLACFWCPCFLYFLLAVNDIQLIMACEPNFQKFQNNRPEKIEMKDMLRTRTSQILVGRYY